MLNSILLMLLNSENCFVFTNAVNNRSVRFVADSIGCGTSVRLAEYAHNMLALRGNATQTRLA
jgi:hypothetical protein